MTPPDEISMEMGSCTMTKVRVTPSILLYRQAMADLVDRVCEQDRIASEGCEDIEQLDPTRKDILELWTPGLLFPPQVEGLCPELWLEDGRLHGIILISTSEYFGVMNVYVTLEDEQGNRLESGYAVDNDVMKNYWGYIPSAPAHSGMAVIVRAIVRDRLGGVGIKTERTTVCHKEELRAG